MIRGVNYGKDLQAFRCEVQTGSLPGGLEWSDADKRDLPGAPAALPDRQGLAGQVSTGATALKAISQGEALGEGKPKALCQDWAALGGDRPFKKIPRDASTPEKRRFIGNYWKEFGSVSKACQRVGLSQSSYYYQPKVDPLDRARRDAELRDRIEAIQAQFPAYGVRQVYWELLWVYHQRINRKRIARVMKKYGLKALIYKGFKVCTTDSNHSNRIYPNLLHGKEVSTPNQVWVSDITYVRIHTGFVYLAAILDLGVTPKKWTESQAANDSSNWTGDMYPSEE